MIAKEWVDVMKWEDVKSCPYHGRALYAFFDGDECVYIGQTYNLRQRMVGHANSRMYKDRSLSEVRWKEMSSQYYGGRSMDTIERFLIDHYRPKYNRYFTGCKQVKA